MNYPVPTTLIAINVPDSRSVERLTLNGAVFRADNVLANAARFSANETPNR